MSDAYDSPWKEMLELYFPQFMEFFFPEAFREIDWDRGWESCDQDLQQVVRDAEIGKRVADKLMKVWRLDGEEQYVLIHVEVQGERDDGFPLRMYTYNYRLFDRHHRPVVSLAILGDDSPSWRPEGYGYELWGCRVGLTFPVVKLRDYNDRWAELEGSANVFATVVMTHLKTRATRRDPERRFRWKMRLVRRLYEGGYARQDVLELFRFIDWLLALPPELERRFNDELMELETEEKMRYVTSIERMGREDGLAKGLELGREQGMERGLEQGIQQGIRQGMEQGLERGILEGEASVLRRQLKRRFEQLPAWVEERLEGASRQELESWADRVLEARALEDVFATDS